MHHDEFIGRVQDRADLDSRGAAEAVTRAALQTIAERLEGGLPQNIGSQLPPEIARHLDDEGSGERFDLDEFRRRVTDRERESMAVDPPEAAFHARAVMSVVADAITGEQLDRVRDQLTPDWSQLFDFSFA